MSAATLPDEQHRRRAAKEDFLIEVGPFIAQKCRLEGMYCKLTIDERGVMTRHYPEWVAGHITTIDQCIQQIMARIARRHELPSLVETEAELEKHLA